MKGLSKFSLRRHQIKVISRVIYRQATGADVLHGYAAPPNVLGVLGLIFYILLLASEFTFELKQVYSQLGYGTIRYLTDMPLEEFPVYSEGVSLFYGAIGNSIACSSCSGIQKNNVNNIPIGKSLVRYRERSLSSVILPGPSDLIRTTTQCSLLASPPQSCATANVTCIERENLVKGNNSAYLSFTITSLDSKTAQYVARYCVIAGLDLRGESLIHYSIDSAGFTHRTKVSSILPTDPKSCVDYDGLCLNKPMKNDLSYTFFSRLFSKNITIPTKLWISGGMLPDPADTSISDKEFSTVVSEIIGALLMITSTEYGSYVQEQMLYEDEKGKNMLTSNSIVFSTLAFMGSNNPINWDKCTGNSFFNFCDVADFQIG
jgi:hypothetical protein